MAAIVIGDPTARSEGRHMVGMSCRLLAAGPTLIAAAVLSAGADNPVSSPPAVKAPDWSKYAPVSEVEGEIVKVGENGFTLRVTWFETTSGSGGSRGGGSANLSRYNQLVKGKTPRPRAGGSIRIKEQSEDFDLAFAEGGMVRWQKLSLRPGAKPGEFVPPAEQDRLKLPLGAPGWAADRSDLKEGHLVEVALVRPRDVPLSKAKPEDLKAKYVMIHGENPKPVGAGKPK